MGLFNTTIRSTNGNSANEANENASTSQNQTDFTNGNSGGLFSAVANNQINRLNDVLEFFKRDFERVGYQDALIIQDKISAEKKILIFKKDLKILIEQVKNNYEDNIGELQIHIETRQIQGLIETVSQLKTMEETYRRHINLLDDIKLDVEEESGRFEKIKLSYEVGFQKGLVALTHNRFLNSGSLNTDSK